MTLVGAHDHALVTLSFVLAAFASYTALDLASRVGSDRGWRSHAWLAAAAVAMGGGIWSMHFVAMLAYSLPDLPVHYHADLTLLSLALPILATGAGFFIVSRRPVGPKVLAASGLLVGLGIVAMHYTGMAAMHVDADLSYDSLWVAISVLIAIGAAIVALWLALRNTDLIQRLVASIAMGVAISGMHYAAMRAATFTAHPKDPMFDAIPSHATIGQTGLALAVAGTTFLILFLALIGSMFDRHFAVLADREAMALRVSEERFRRLYKKTPLPLHSLGEDRTIEHVSDAWLDLLGYPRDEVIGRRVSDFMTEESAQRQKELIWPKFLAQGKARDIDYQFITKSGRILDVLVSGNVVGDEEGRILHILGGVVDVTDRKKTEEALRQAQKIEALGHLTGGVAHDFNNLLAVVLGNLELLRKRLPDDPKATRLLDSAVQGAQRGAALTQRLLAFARRQELAAEPVDIPDLVKDMTDLLQRSIGPMVQIETRFPLGMACAHVDAHQLELALLNLVVNARDAMPEGGSVVIAAREQTNTPDDGSDLLPGRYVCLSVTDTGEGMDEATLARAMEPFYTTKGVGKGTGLGLSMVHGLAAQSGGKLILRSRAGEGTTAEIWLPAVQKRASSEPISSPVPAPRGPSMALRPLTILVVDDDALVLANTAAMLEDLGHHVIETGSGQEALTILASGRNVDLVLTDQAMPAMTGVQLAERINTERPDLPIILATGFADMPQSAPSDLRRLSKPFDQTTLAHAIGEGLKPADRRAALPFRPRQG
ncbi:MHYT domain-containing protein [Microvirga zambiensis]|uniref:MHYT domain-containing protein n=1 Tax=Microvirga zambiensis TaxID=1402137 RepID=UPI00191D71F3|nr:MHYT domain-containing protein [Microvirga zambiensis]